MAASVDFIINSDVIYVGKLQTKLLPYGNFSFNAVIYVDFFFLLVVPPEKPTLYDRWGRQLNKSVGPHDEGDDVQLTCRVIGGKYSMRF